jgi:hypothetical protein
MCHGRAHGKTKGIHKNPNEWRRLIELGRERWIANGGVQGRSVGSVESIETFMRKPVSVEIKQLVEQGKSVRNISGIIGVSTSTVVKVRKYMNLSNTVDPVQHTFF